MLVNALLVRELGKAGLIDVPAMHAEVIKRAEPLGASVVAVVQSIFGGEGPRASDIPSKAALYLIPGGRDEP